MKVKYEENLVEVTESSIKKIAIMLILEPALAAGVYYFATNEQGGNGRYLFVIVLSFFFLGLATGLLPLIKHILNSGTMLMVWAANSEGFLVPAKVSERTKYRPPIVYAWHEIKSVLFVNKLVENDFEGTGVSYNRCLVILSDLKLPDNWLDRLTQSVSRMKDGTNYMIFSFPKAEKEKIIRNIKEIAPNSIFVHELDNYEIK